MNIGPKILVYDLESFPASGFFWNRKWETNIIEILEQSPIISFSAKWLGGKQLTKCLADYKGYKKGSKDDKKLVQEVWNLFNEADIIITQNGRAYDSKMTNARFLYHGLTPPSPYKMVDTKLEARKYFKLPSYSLDDMCQYFGLGSKMKHEGFDLWTKCIAGDKSAYKRMKGYNAHDVVLTEKLYLKLRSYAKVNLGIFYNSDIICPTCGSKSIQSRGVTRNQTTSYRRVFCNDCGSWFRSTKNIQEVKPLISI